MTGIEPGVWGECNKRHHRDQLQVKRIVIIEYWTRQICINFRLRIARGGFISYKLNVFFRSLSK